MALKAVTAPLGSPVGGSGTPGTIPVWSSGTTLGDSQLIQSATAVYTTTRNFGVGATPASWNTAVRAIDMRTSALWNFNSGSDSVAYWTVNAFTDTGGNVVYKASAAASQYTQIGGAHVWSRAVSGTAGAACAFLESARIDANGVLTMAGNGTAAAPIIANSTGVSGLYFPSATTAAIAANGAVAATFSRVAGAGVALGGTTGLIFDASGTQQGLKLPATPGNADTQTLDCYQENPLATTAGNGWTPTLSAAATWGGTQPTVDYARYIRIGSMVFCEVRLSGAALTATYGTTTISQPPVTINATAIESAVPVSTAAGSGVGVCTSTSVFLPTLGATTAMRLSWFYFTTS